MSEWGTGCNRVAHSVKLMPARGRQYMPGANGIRYERGGGSIAVPVVVLSASIRASAEAKQALLKCPLGGVRSVRHRGLLNRFGYLIRAGCYFRLVIWWECVLNLPQPTD